MSNGSNIERFLDYLLKITGDKLVIGIKEPLYILKAANKISLLKRVLEEKEFQAVEAEYRKMFAPGDAINYKGTQIYARWVEGQLEFSLQPAPAAPASPVPPKPSAAPGPAAASPKAPATTVPPTPPARPSPTAPAAPVAPAVPAPSSPPVMAPNTVDLKPLDLEALLKLMVQKNASDLHLSSKCKPAMRIDGDMIILEDYDLISSDTFFKELEKITPERNIKEFHDTNDTDYAYSIEGVARFRANIFRDIRGVGAVFRVIPSKILSVKDLNVPPAVVKMCGIPKGLILVTGPTGSGKSTTLATLINHINENHRKHIITIEDPVEFVHPNKQSLINQREVNTHTQSFKRALRAALREDPDIILVGEMRDLETIAIAIEMAVTGHLVFGTLHTSTAISTVDRIIDQFPSGQQQQIRTMLADALIGVLAQTLLKKKKGGRIAGFEVLVVTPAVSNLIREGKNYQVATLMQTGKALGMQMINTHLAQLVEQGVVEVEEAIDKATDKENLITTLKGKGLVA